MVWVPETIRWIAASSASWPVIGGSGLTPAAFMAAMAPPAVPSFAASTPSTLLFSAVKAWVISFWALSGLHIGVSYSLAMLVLPSSTLWAPCLNRVALLSVGSPLISTTVGLVFDPSAVSRAVPWSLPTPALSKEM